MIITVRDVEEQVFREFRTKAVSRGMKTGIAANEAFREWARKDEPKKLKKRSFFDMVKPWDWGPGSENSSMEIDKNVYGDLK